MGTFHTGINNINVIPGAGVKGEGYSDIFIYRFIFCSKLLNFNIFWDFQKIKYFWGYEDIVFFLFFGGGGGGHCKTRLCLVYFYVRRVFS